MNLFFCLFFQGLVNSSVYTTYLDNKSVLNILYCKQKKIIEVLDVFYTKNPNKNEILLVAQNLIKYLKAVLSSPEECKASKLISRWLVCGPFSILPQYNSYLIANFISNVLIDKKEFQNITKLSHAYLSVMHDLKVSDSSLKRVFIGVVSTFTKSSFYNDEKDFVLLHIIDEIIETIKKYKKYAKCFPHKQITELLKHVVENRMKLQEFLEEMRTQNTKKCYVFLSRDNKPVTVSSPHLNYSEINIKNNKAIYSIFEPKKIENKTSSFYSEEIKEFIRCIETMNVTHGELLFELLYSYSYDSGLDIIVGLEDNEDSSITFTSKIFLREDYIEAILNYFKKELNLTDNLYKNCKDKKSTRRATQEIMSQVIDLEGSPEREYKDPVNILLLSCEHLITSDFFFQSLFYSKKRCTKCCSEFNVVGYYELCPIQD